MLKRMTKSANFGTCKTMGPTRKLMVDVAQ